MTLSEFVADVAAKRKTLVVYASEAVPDATAQFETRNVDVERESIAPDGPGGFVVLRDETGFLGAFGLAELAELLEPPLFRPWYRDDLSQPWRALYEVLDETLFTSFDRRQLLAAAREIENRAWRVGDGTLRVGFQRPAAYRAQRPVYRRLASETELTIHVSLAGEWDAEPVPGTVVHAADGTEIGDYWFLVFDGGSDRANACALLAEERVPGSYDGFWTYSPERVDAMASYLERTDG